jgi:5-methylcytosine-specific restriction enzyme subunit McrC
MHSPLRRTVKCEEWAKLVVDDKSGPISRADLQAIFATWKGSTRTDPLKYFDVGPNFVSPKFWSGTLHCGRFTLEVSPIGASNLPGPERSAFEKNLSEMLASVLGGVSMSATDGALNSNGSNVETLLQAFCRAFHIARRVRVIRSYVSVTKQGPTLSGRLSFPRQSILDVAAPGEFASTSIRFSEDTPENRLIALVFRRFRPVCSPSTRRHIDACLGELGYVSAGIDVLKEWQRVRFDRLPAEYQTLLRQARSLLDGNFAGLLDGEVFATSEIVFTSRLFERYVAQELARAVAGFGHEMTSQTRGSYLCRTSEGHKAFELIPDILVRRDGKFTAVADTKWKKLQPERRGFGISPEDLYQSLTYAAHFGCAKAVLIFPNSSLATGSAMLFKSLRSQLRGQAYDVEVIGLPMLSSVRDGCRAAAHRLLGS